MRNASEASRKRWTWLVTMILVTLPDLLLARQVSAVVTGFDKRYVGAWESTSDPKILLGVESSRVVENRNRRLSVYQVIRQETQRDQSSYVLRNKGRDSRWVVSISEGTLVVERGGSRETFSRRPDRIAEVILVPLQAERTARALSADEKEAIVREINRRYSTEQDLFKRSIDDEKYRPEAENAVVENQAYMRSLFNRFGWLGSKAIGVEASARAVLLIKHTGDLRLLSTILPLAAEDLIANDNAQIYAVALDSLKLELGERQVFGTQTAQDVFGPCILPVEGSLANVEARLRDLYLPSLQEYLDVLGKVYYPGKVLRPRSCAEDSITVASNH